MKATSSLLLFGLFAAGVAAEDKPARKANFTVSKETTYVTGPLDKDEYVDYAAALNERLGKGVTPDTNANVLIWKALGPKPEGRKGMPAEFYKLLGISEPPEKGDYFVGLSTFARDQLGIEDMELRGEIEGQLTKAMRRPWAARDYPYVSSWLKANEKPIDLIVEGTRRPRYFNPLVPKRGEERSSGLIGVLLPALQKCRATASALTARAMLRMQEEKADEAWQDLLACHRLGRHVGRGGTLVEGLVGIAIEAIAQRADVTLLDRPELTAKALQGYRRDFQALPPLPTIADHVNLGERFMFLDTLMLTDRKGLQDIVDALGFPGNLPAGVPDRKKLPAGPMENINWDPALRSANRRFDRLTAALNEPDRGQREKQLDRIEADLKELKQQVRESADWDKALVGDGITPEARAKLIGDLLVTLMAPPVRKMQEAYDRNEQGQKNLYVAFALAAYQRDNGTYPKTLDALAPKYLDKVPGDLFAGKPLVYRPEGKGFLLYSFGPNGKDDGGQSQRDDPPGDDIAVRIPVHQK